MIWNNYVGCWNPEPGNFTYSEQSINSLIDKSDAPDGYTPIPKVSFRNTTPWGDNNKNICTNCDWRCDCDGSKFSCMSYKRKDGISVVFKIK